MSGRPRVHTTARGVDLAYETFGDRRDPAVLLVAGLGAQLLSWDERLCRRIAAGGRHVIRFDNRDAGLSTRFDAHPVEMASLVGAAGTGDVRTVRGLAPYTLWDMADDAVALLDGLGFGSAHLVGASLGGMIAQAAAIRYPERTITLTSMMSSTGETEFGQSTPEAMAALMTPAAADRASHVAQAVAAGRTWGSRRHFDESAVAAAAGEAYDRSSAPGGVARQLAALLATGSLADDLRRLAVSTLVIHGLDDTLIAPSGGERTAALVPGAELLLLEHMGHDRPEPLWPVLVDAILAHTA